MSRTKKTGKTFRRVRVKEDVRGVQDAIAKRHTFGSTEKILRRNRKLWVRLGNKRRRADDKRKIEE